MTFDFNCCLYFFSFQERLAAQRKEREMANAELGFKKQLTKEEKFEKKKQRLAAIGYSVQPTNRLDTLINGNVYSINCVMLTQIKFCRRGSFGDCC